jgi:hypothetical protein
MGCYPHEGHPDRSRMTRKSGADLFFAEAVWLAKPKGRMPSGTSRPMQPNGFPDRIRFQRTVAPPNGRVMPHGRKPVPGVASAHGNTQVLILHRSPKCSRYGQRAPPPAPTRQFTGRSGTGDRGAPPRARAPRIRAPGGRYRRASFAHLTGGKATPPSPTWPGCGACPRRIPAQLRCSS